MEQGEGVLGSEGVADLLGVGCGQLQGERGLDVAAGGADAECVGAGLGEPLGIGLVEGGKLALLDGHRERLALTGLQLSGLGEGLQLLRGLLKAALGGLDIDLCHLLACRVARVLDVHRDGDDVAREAHLGL